MRVALHCPTCVAKSGSQFGNKQYFVEINNELFFETVCDEGHEIKMTLEGFKYSVLFDFGVHAYRDGYYREAVSSFATSLERFYETFIKIICFKHSLETEHILNSWKQVSAQSERQYGAMIFLFTIDSGTSFTPIKPTLTTFRNNVVHKGYLPTRQECFDYAEAVHDHIIEFTKYLNLNCSNALARYVHHERTAITKNSPSAGGIIHYGANIVPLYENQFTTQSFLEKFDRFKNSRWLFPPT